MIQRSYFIKGHATITASPMLSIRLMRPTIPAGTCWMSGGHVEHKSYVFPTHERCNLHNKSKKQEAVEHVV